MKNYNSQSFVPEEVNKGLHTKFIQYLLDTNKDLEGHYLDIHITSDGYCTIVEWCDVSFDHEDGRFCFVDSDQVIMTEKVFPDNHIELCYNEEDYEEKLADWLKENPGWVKTSWGTWTNEIENKKWQEELEKELTKETHYENGIPQGE